MPPPVSGSTSPTLPYDVLVTVVSMLDRPTLKQARLCCKWLAKEATRHLFATVSLQMRAVDMERVVAIANCSTTANAVKVLQLEQVPRLPKYELFEDWKSNARKNLGRSSHENPGLPRILQLNEAKKLTARTDLESGQDDDEANEPSEESQEKYYQPALTKQLFRQYEAQRKEPKLWIGLHAPGPSFSEAILDPSTQNVDRTASGLLTWRQNVRRLRKACLDLEEALLNLPNLQQLRIDHGVYEAVHDAYWRGYHFMDYNFTGLFRLPDVAQEAAPIAFLLRILGKRNLSSNSLTSLRLTLDCEMWWSLQNLEVAWISPEDGEYEDDEQDQETFGFRSDAIAKRNMSMAEETFVHLTDIRIALAAQDDPANLFEALARYLSKAKKLERLDLSTYDLDEMPENLDMLSAINDCARWPTLRHLTLDTYHFREKTILRTLLLVAPTLESLTLYNCTLVGEESSWSEFYDHMRLIPFEALDHLQFTRGVQTAFHEELLDNPRETPPRKDGDPLPVVHMMEEYSETEDLEYIIGYSPEIYDYILKRTDAKPPLQLFRKFSDSRDAFEEFFLLL